MLTTRADHVTTLMAALSRHVTSGADGPLAGDDEIRRITAHEQEMARLVERLDGLGRDELGKMVAALDDVQIRSKLWLIDRLSAHRELSATMVVVLGAWYGVLPLLLSLTVQPPPSRMVCVDLDPAACDVGSRTIGVLYPTVEYRVEDVMELDYSAISAEPYILINTICEHLPDIETWWSRVPLGVLVVLQSNNYAACPDHVNWVSSVEEMAAQTPMSRVVYRGTLDVSIFDRFMLIGYR